MAETPWWQRICTLVADKRLKFMMTEEKEPKEPLHDQEQESSFNELEDMVDVDENQEDNEDSTDQVQELKDKYLRLFAEFDNFKKRTVRERLDLMKSASQDMMTALLPVLDDFDRARKTAEEQIREGDSVIEGLFLVHHKLFSLLKNKGLEEMASTGLAFDPEIHEAITEIPSPSPEMKGMVIETIEKGYRLNEKIIRYAKVVVGA